MTRGGYNHHCSIDVVQFDIGEYLPPDNKNISVLAGAIYATDAKSSPIPYPPTHIDHAHLCPYEER